MLRRLPASRAPLWAPQSSSSPSASRLATAAAAGTSHTATTGAACPRTTQHTCTQALNFAGHAGRCQQRLHAGMQQEQSVTVFSLLPSGSDIGSSWDQRNLPAMAPMAALLGWVSLAALPRARVRREAGRTSGACEAVRGRVQMQPLQPSASHPSPAASASGAPAGSPISASARKRGAASHRSYHLPHDVRTALKACVSGRVSHPVWDACCTDHFNHAHGTLANSCLYSPFKGKGFTPCCMVDMCLNSRARI